MIEPIKSPATAAKAVIWINSAFFLPVLDTNIRPYRMISANLRRQSDVVQASSSTKSAYRKISIFATNSED